MEMKALHNPPQGVKDTLFAFMAIIGRRQPGANEWKNCRKHLGDPRILDTLKNFDPKSVTPEDAKYARTLTADISAAAIRAKSAAASSVLTWVKTVLDMRSC